MTISYFFQQLLNGLSLGGAYALIAIGYTMVYGILRMINFAHGDVFMMAGYFAIYSMAAFPWQLSLPIVIIGTIVLGVVIERIAYKPLRTAPRMSVMISAIGVSYFLENLANYLFTAMPQSYPQIDILKQIHTFGDITVSRVTIIAPIITIVLTFLLMTLVNHTKLGMAMRACSKDQDTARIMGIKVDRVITMTFVIGCGLAAIGSILYFTDRNTVQPYSGSLPGLKCFVAAVLGGIGSIPGAMVGGFIVGICQIAITAAGYSVFSDAFTFVLLIFILIIRPTGIFGEKATDKV
ncbi:branched-chain amino acid transport system permease protein [Pseudobutyrivibrio sp. NOR37]|jgi:branched-chain amino acid transport system permease protein|uniref:Branched-chain amino acid ABC transporter permease n=1 Tax=Pseudobutyrivibrio xylanivorans TaxID=185007 RepID=A0A6M0LHX0_PSEXY|nr:MULTISPECIES: branched-chain amino acid ABC transporter permease [Pseudobutyrivibrio]MBP5595112.1 branched-chain amino acid ABC transporter permease [Pseudobutyrivibrio sp.]MBR5952897.1 branched-chain amino acid ABC transporter permease [Pseudobutyrivibrio sp.]NEX02026.1 branched-chain amino acid ABC transporter permease [Pseudobutyrivibrio xylanivorans]SFR73688.1 branched-chain amino acid transport system permease protein [Pseudobutyrivibrio sp. NOR37]